MSEAERAAAGIPRLPTNLGEALRVARDGDVAREALGDAVFDNFIRNKEIEWRAYEETVTDYEVRRYLNL